MEQHEFSKQFTNLAIVSDDAFLKEHIEDFLACITSEVEEIREELPWKHWKKYTKSINHHELRVEVVDLWKFVMNLTILLFCEEGEPRVKDVELFLRYFQAKSKENIERQDRGYSDEEERGRQEPAAFGAMD